MTPKVRDPRLAPRLGALEPPGAMPPASAPSAPGELSLPPSPAPRGRAAGERGGESRRLPSLDGLRAISISLVLLWHMPKSAPIPGLDQLWRIDAGNLGVRVFFVISGFLITSLLLAEHEATGTVSLKRFYLRRTFRIMPAAYVFLAAMWVAGLLGLQQLSAASVLKAATYTSNYLPAEWPVGHTWSLSVEEQFYLLWPGLLVLLGLRGGFRVALVMLLASPLFRTAAAVLGQWPANPRYAFECVADALAMGCLLARYRGSLWAWRPYRALLESRLGALLPLAVLLAAAVGARWPVVGAAVGLSALNVAIALTIDWCLRFPRSLFGRVLNAAPVAFVGTLSYSLYLWQQPFFDEKSTMPLALRLGGIAGCALASYYVVEKPFLTLRGRVERRLFRRS